MKELLRATTPESVGVSSKNVQMLINDMVDSNVKLHSLLILRDNRLAVEAYKAPIRAEDTHMMFSVSKSFLSVAYGFAVGEGLLNEQTLFLDVFPEYAKNAHEYLKKLTLFDLIGMRSGKRTARGKKNWLDSFVKAKWDFEPGTQFRYVSDNYYAASAALTKLAGMSVTEYLTDRLYKPLGIETPLWETSPQGIESGGWGMFLKPVDVAKFILCCHNNGKYDGVQVIPADWLEKATFPLSDSSLSQSESDSMAGYGYGFWRCAGKENAFRCEGLYSQYAISLKDYDACIVMTGGCAQLQKTLDILWKHVDGIFTEKSNSASEQIVIPPTVPFKTQQRSGLEKQIDGRVYALRKQWFITLCGFPAGALTMPAIFFAKEKGGNITDLSFCFEENGFLMKWTEEGGFKNEHFVSFDGSYSRGCVHVGELHFNSVAYGRWLDENKLEVIIKAIGNVIDRRFVFTFKGKRITMYPDMSPSMDERAASIGEKLKTVLKGRYFEWWINFLVPKVKYIIQPLHHGRVKASR